MRIDKAFYFCFGDIYKEARVELLFLAGHSLFIRKGWVGKVHNLARAFITGKSTPRILSAGLFEIKMFDSNFPPPVWLS